MNAALGRVFVSKEWLLQDPIKTLAKVTSQLRHPLLQTGAHPYAPIFYKRAAITMIYVSNKLERTLPLGASAHDTYRVLHQMMIPMICTLHPPPPGMLRAIFRRKLQFK
jgi:hypothetical protein